MTLVLIASQPNGTRQDTHGEAKSDQVEFRQANGTAPDHFDGTLVATYTDSAGTGSSTAAFSADSRGRWMRYIASGFYKQIVNPSDLSRRESLDFHATPGSVESNIQMVRLSSAAGANITPAAVAAAFADAVAQGKQGVLLPYGSGQKLTGTITVPDGMGLAYEQLPTYVQNPNRVINYGSLLGRVVVDATFPDTVAIQLGANSWVRGLHMDGTGSTGVMAIRAYTSATWSRDYGVIAEDCHIENFAVGIGDNAAGTQFQGPNRISNCDISGCTTGIDLRKSSDLTIDRNCDIHDNGVGIYLQGVGMTAILGARIEGNTGKGISIFEPTRLLITGGCRFDRNFEEAIYITSTITGQAQQNNGFVAIYGNTFSGNGTNLTQSTSTPSSSRCIYVQRGRYVAIEHNEHFARTGQKNGQDPPNITPQKFAVLEDCLHSSVKDNDGTISHGVATKRIEAISVANPTVITVTAHGLTTGDRISVLLDEASGVAQPVLNGNWTVTVTDANHFTIPVNVTSVAAQGGVTNYFVLGAIGTPVHTEPVDVIDTNIVSSVELDSNQFTIAGDQPTKHGVSPRPKDSLIPSGDMDAWPNRPIGTAISLATQPQAIMDDGWQARFSGSIGAGVATVTPKAFVNGQTDVAGNPLNFLEYACTTLGSWTALSFDRRIPDARLFSGERVVVSFWAFASDSSGNPGSDTAITLSAVQNFGTGGSTQVVTSQAVTIGRNGWRRYEVALNIPSVSGKTIATDGTAFFSIAFSLPVATTFNLRFAKIRLERGVRASTADRTPTRPHSDRSITIDVLGPTVDQVGTWAFSVVTTAIYNGYKANTAVQNDYLAWDHFFEAGTYKVRLMGRPGTTRGIASIQLDDVEVAALDMYNAATPDNTEFTASGIVVQTPGVKRVKMKLANKNASSSGYAAFVNALAFVRTA